MIVVHHLPGQLWMAAEAMGSLCLHQGVSFFFVLSGFILQHSHRNQVWSAGAAARFVALRFSRLWPCHLGVLFLIVLFGGPPVVEFFDVNYSLAEILSVIFLVQAWTPNLKSAFALNGPAWSISVEMFFYLCFPVLSMIAIKRPRVVFGIGAAVSFVWIVAASVLIEVHQEWDASAVGSIVPVARLFEFAFGIALYEARLRMKDRAPSGTLWEVIAAAIAITMFLLTPQFLDVVAPHISAPAAYLLSASFSFPAFGLLILTFSRESGSLSRAAGSSVTVYLGEISFALYLIHQPAIFYLKHHAPWFQVLPLPVQVGLFVVIVLGLSSFLFFSVERPALRLAKRWLLLPGRQLRTA